MTDFKIALVGDDGSEKAALAVAWAHELAARTDLELRALRVTDQDDVAERRALTSELEARVCEPARLRGVHASADVALGDPRDVFLERITDQQADLVVVGDTGRWGVIRPPLGSLAAHLVHHSPQPVAVVAGAGGPLDGARLVVGVDGSDDSRAALAWAAALAARLGGSVEAVALYDPLADSYPHGPAASSWHTTLEPMARAAVSSVEEPGVPIDLQVFGAQRVEGLLEVGTDGDAAAIVVGARGRGGFRRLLVGGTALQLLHHADRPVVVVPSHRQIA
ncbi:MAG TPA: universal stress protein [Acidimicrobiales bacterium]|nr:universal stress protein [Acidimicrobiales bacterium]